MTDQRVVTRRQHGFAVIVAVVMIAILGMALLALTTLFQTDTQRSMRNRAEGQLRQLLIAGGAAAVQRVSNEPQATEPTQLAVPDAIENASVTIAYEPEGESMIRATVTAQIDVHQAVQSMTFTQTGTGWALRDAQLVQQK
jgi:type II secretory pathway component PulK